jgi:hypothetical protein
MDHFPNIDLSHLSPEDIERAKRLSEDPETRALLYLVSRKIPWDLSKALTFDEKVTSAKAIARIEDSDFEWSTMKLTRLRGKSMGG